MLWMIKQIRPTQVHLTFTRDILLCSYYYTAVEKWCNSLVQNFRSWLMHTKNSPLPRLFKANSVCDTGILSFDVIRYTEWLSIHIKAFAFGINRKNTWSGTMKDIITKSFQGFTNWVDYCSLYRRVIWQLLTPCSVIKKLAAVIRTAMEIRVVLVVKDRL